MSKEIPVWYNKIGNDETNRMIEAIQSGSIMEGPYLREFELMVADYLGVKHVIGTASGTSALTMALMALGIKPGDEVVVPDITFIATANAPHILGAKVVVAPTINGGTLLDLNALKSIVSEKTKVVISVDHNGRMVDTNILKKICSPLGIAIVSDSCQAFGSGSINGKAGTQADITCFSFGITKTISTLKGGAAVTDNTELFEKMSLIKTQGMKSVFEGDHYYCPGFNFKLPDVLASVGIEQLKKIEDTISHMKEMDALYNEKLRGIDGISFSDRKKEEFIWMTDIICDDRDSIRERLKAGGVQTRPLGKPLHNAEYLNKVDMDYPAGIIQPKLLALPSGPDIELSVVDKIVSILTNCNK